jgi:spore coat protein U domain-containing protein, fimbrial subunit CupE1/2/3/6
MTSTFGAERLVAPLPALTASRPRPGGARPWIGRVAIALLLACSSVQSASAANVTCTPSNSIINFGPYDVLAGATVPGASTFDVTCTGTGIFATSVTYTAKLAVTPTRLMAPPSGSDRVSYGIYVDSARTQPWGDGTGGTFTITGGPHTLWFFAPSWTDSGKNFYGLISPGGQDVSAASPAPPPTTYSQILTITVTCTPSPPC